MKNITIGEVMAKAKGMFQDSQKKREDSKEEIRRGTKIILSGVYYGIASFFIVISVRFAFLIF